MRCKEYLEHVQMPDKEGYCSFCLTETLENLSSDIKLIKAILSELLYEK